MKIQRHQNPSSNTLRRLLETQKPASVLEIELESSNDLRAISSEINKFVANDLSKHTVIVSKQR